MIKTGMGRVAFQLCLERSKGESIIACCGGGGYIIKLK
jgi:hypothetical protein